MSPAAEHIWNLVDELVKVGNEILPPGKRKKQPVPGVRDFHDDWLRVQLLFPHYPDVVCATLVAMRSQRFIEGDRAIPLEKDKAVEAALPFAEFSEVQKEIYLEKFASF